MVRKFTAARKQQGKASVLVPKAALKGAPKRKKKNNTKEDCSSKKATGPSVGDQQQKSPPPPRHGVGKGLMMGKGPVGLGPPRG